MPRTIEQAYRAGVAAALDKFGSVFGADEPDHLEHAGIPFELRQKLYEKYLQQKGQESPTGYGAAMLGGGGLGALLGGGLGLAAGKPGMGAGIGGGIGALLGAGVAAGDKHKIEHAQQTLDGGHVQDELVKNIGDRADTQRMIDGRRHRQLMMASQHPEWAMLP